MRMKIWSVEAWTRGGTKLAFTVRARTSKKAMKLSKQFAKAHRPKADWYLDVWRIS